VQVTAHVVVDATGHARRLTEMDGKHNPGYQAAYGIMAGMISCHWGLLHALLLADLTALFPGH
jgi:ribulose 1,5-bisphosphate synthetase/thiazole synthase